MRIVIRAGVEELAAELIETRLAERIFKLLPLKAMVRRWGDEVYFPIDLEQRPEKKQVEMERGDLAFWSEGGAFCIFFGPTPAGASGEIRAAAPVEVFGRLLTDDYTALKGLSDGDQIKVVGLDKA